MRIIRICSRLLAVLAVVAVLIAAMCFVSFAADPTDWCVVTLDGGVS